MARKESCEEDIQSSPLVAAKLLPLGPYVTPLSRPRNPFRQADRDLQLGRQVLRRDGHAPSGAEAYGLVEGGCITAENFRDFVFADTARL
jgi:hypothetical protein